MKKILTCENNKPTCDFFITAPDFVVKTAFNPAEKVEQKKGKCLCSELPFEPGTKVAVINARLYKSFLWIPTLFIDGLII